MGCFLHRFALAGQAGLADKQILGFQNPHIGRDHIAGGQMHDIARYQFIHRDLCLFLPLTGDCAGGGDHGQQFFRSVAASGFLHKAKGTRKDHHSQDDHHRQAVKILRHTSEQRKVGENHVRHRGYKSQKEQDGGKRIDKGICQTPCQRLFLLVGYLVAAVSGSAGRYCFCVKAAERGVQFCQNVFNGMGGRIFHAAVLLIADGCFFRRLADRDGMLFLVHGSYLPAVI